MDRFDQHQRRIWIFLIAVTLVGCGVWLIRQIFPTLFLGEPIAIESNPQVEKQIEKTESEIIVSEKSEISDPPSKIKIKININTATADQLETLPRIGPVMSKRIIEYRDQFGDFRTLEELTDVKGIGEKTLGKIRDQITIE